MYAAGHVQISEPKKFKNPNRKYLVPAIAEI
jgi:hypothetical protein